jgi:DNA polymerase II large subunit
MDAPLVVTTLLNPYEIDDEAHKMEVVSEYPPDFYAKTWENASPYSCPVKIVKNVLAENPYNNLHFTHSTGNINGPVHKSKYVKLETMEEKVIAQLEIAEKIRAIDERAVAEIVINSHFLRDTYGNLKAFTRQKFRCVKCNASYRRVPLAGKCTKCGGKLLLTVTEGSIRKYLELTKNLINKYELSDYLKQRLILLEKDITSLFTNDLAKQISLADFM